MYVKKLAISSLPLIAIYPLKRKDFVDYQTLDTSAFIPDVYKLYNKKEVRNREKKKRGGMLISVMRNVLINPRRWIELRAPRQRYIDRLILGTTTVHIQMTIMKCHIRMCVSYIQDAYSLRICGFRR